MTKSIGVCYNMTSSDTVLQASKFNLLATQKHPSQLLIK
jgi:hypothetical protein